MATGSFHRLRLDDDVLIRFGKQGWMSHDLERACE